MFQLIDRLANEPFRLFFPLGIGYLLVAILFWPLSIMFNTGIHFAPNFHALLMILGFLFSFIVGFLGTALPRISGTKAFSSYELALLLLPFLFIAHGIFTGQTKVLFAALALTLIFFVILLGKRFAKRKKNPPPSFVFIPAALLALFLSSFIYLLPQPSPALLLLAKLFLYQGSTLMLLVGVGSFLIKSILGWAPAMPSQPGDKLPVFSDGWRKPFHLVAMLLTFISYPLEAFNYPLTARLIRAVTITTILLVETRIHLKPNSTKLTSSTLRYSLIILALGLWGQFLVLWLNNSDAHYLSFEHLIFYGGFLISTLSVATRVTLSHCGYATLLNQKYVPYTLAMLLIFLGLLGRFVAEFTHSYAQHLAWSALTLCAGILIWSSFILSKCIANTLAAQSSNSTC